MGRKMFRKKSFTIMTWNLYVGADITPLIGKMPNQVPEAVTEVFNQLRQTDFLTRAKSIAEQIYQTKPDLIGLQEVALLTVQFPRIKRVIDFLRILLKELKKLGLKYDVIAINENSKISLPSSKGNIIGLLDRDVILARDESPMEFSNIQENNFKTNLAAPIGNQLFTILRGWSSVDISIADQKFKLVNTHLEAYSTIIRMGQAIELLLKESVAADIPVVFVGDFNSNAERNVGLTYSFLSAVGFSDAWDIAGNGAGYTAIQDPDLLNSTSNLDERIDFILFQDGFNVQKIDTVGDKQKDRTSSGLWPSDHAGVVATFEF